MTRPAQRASAVTIAAWGLWAVTTACALGSIAFDVLTRVGAFGAPWVVTTVGSIAFLLLTSVGLVLTVRRPENRVGWLLALAVLGFGLSDFGRAYGTYAFSHPGSLPGGHVATTLLAFNAVGLSALPLLLLLFPTGRMPSRHWAPAAWVMTVAGGLLFAALLLTPHPMLDGLPDSTNLTGIDALRNADLLGTLFSLNIGLILIGLVSLLVRFFRAHGDERQQLKWVAFGATLLLASFWVEELGSIVLDAITDVASVAALAGTLLAALLKYRLYDIDRVISRTIAYTVVSALIGLVYLGGVVVLGRVLDPGSGDSSLAVAISTLAAATLALPVRRRIQNAVDRQFNRRHYDAIHTVSTFSARLRAEVDLDALSAELLTVVDQTMQPTHASLWLRPATTDPPAHPGR